MAYLKYFLLTGNKNGIPVYLKEARRGNQTWTTNVLKAKRYKTRNGAGRMYGKITAFPRVEAVEVQEFALNSQFNC